MWIVILCAGIWFGFIVYWVTGSLPKGRVYEVYAGCGIGICLTLLLLGLGGWYQSREDSPVLHALYVAGKVLYLASMMLVLVTFATLRRRGKPEGFVERTTVLVENGVFGIIRHPLYLGLALWSTGLVLHIQPNLPAILGIVALGCFWMASKKEDEYNVEKFGASYRAYMSQVPMWNLFKGLRSRGKA